MSVCQRLQDAGFKAYLAGGCVRDALLGRMANDFDVATEALPEELEKLFPKAIPVGKEFGVIILPFQGFQIEVATFRSDGEYRDGRHPEEVHFSSPKEDALRRDFTINALFYDLQTQQVIDYVQGQADLSQGVLRTVGEPAQRFAEDKLRVLRAVRIGAQLNFEMEEATFKAVCQWAPQVGVVSQERITTELRKMLLLPNRVQALHGLQVSGLAQVVLPELSYFDLNHETLWRKTIHLAQLMGEEVRLGVLWSVLLWQEVVGLKEEHADGENWLQAVRDVVELILRQLKCSRDEINETIFVLSHFGELSQDSPSKVKSLLLLDQIYGLSALDFAMAVAAVEGVSQQSLVDLQQLYLSKVDSATGRLAKCWVTGQDLMAIGFRPGPELGTVLEQIYHSQVGGQVANKKEALAMARALKGNG